MKAFFVSLTHKMLLANLLLVLITLGFVWLYVVPSYERQLEFDRIEATQQAVDVTVTMLDQIRMLGARRGIKESEVQERALTFLRGTRYNRFKAEQSIGYFWVHDLNTVMLMHPFKSSLEGSNLSEFRDADNVRVFYDMNQLVKDKGAGTVRYNWPLPNGVAPQAKISYVRLYEPWGWVIGSGIYLDDILQRTERLRVTLLTGSILVFSGLLILSALLAGRINKPYQALHRLSERIAGRISPEDNTAHNDTGDVDLAISTMQQMLKEMEQAKDEAERANATKSRFLAMTSHDLRTPLANIANLAELLKDGTPPPSEGQLEYIALIETSAHNLTQLINDLLDLNRIEAGKLELHYQKINLESLISDLLKLHQPAAAAQATTIACSCPGGLLPQVYCDPLRVRQILGNLLSNAIKFTHHGKVTLEISLTPLDSSMLPANEVTWPDDCTVQLLNLEVADTGIGMTQDQIDRIFTPYMQASSSTCQQYGGSGLGLSIVAKLCDLMGGEVAVTSVQGTGSRFRCTVQAAVDNRQIDSEATKV